ncbi:ABC transporter permease [Actinomadura chibensis]|uniref:ABC transporter permease n=1 Tax=Actinomadura chibensis TaxID=392828 RepID=UPI0014716B6A|nr:ABC transporter permease [Actinomadura chibensis]
MSHKLRLMLTALAIVLGVGFVTGTYVLTDTVNKTFDELFTQVTKGVDVAVRTRAAFVGQNGEQRGPMPAALRDRIAGTRGVKAVEGSVSGYAQFVGKDGRPVTTGGAPTIGVSLGAVPELQASGTVRAGHRPSGPDEVAVDARTAEREGFRVGDRVKILFQGRPGEFTVVGVIGFGKADSLAGATLAGFDLPTAQRVLNRPGVYDEIDVVAAPGTDAAALRDRVQARVGGTYQVLTGEQLAEENSRSIAEFTKIINYALLAFAGIALFVGSFIIVNTFSIILAQRTRESALLRCLGASRRQLLASVLGEASIVGLAASLIGLGVGVLIAVALNAAFAALGVDLPSTTLVVRPRTVAVSLLVGLVVTVVASVLPAVRATRVPPVAALRERVVTERDHGVRRRALTGGLISATGAALLLNGLFAGRGDRLLNVSAGALAVFLGIAALSPLIVRPLARLLGWPFARWAGEPGRLARQNAMRSPRRTASTAAALMIGLALVSVVAIFASSIKASVSGVLDETMTADYILTGPSGGGQGFSPEVVRRLTAQPEIESASGLRLGLFKLDGGTQRLAGVDPIAYSRTVRTETVSGDLADMAGGGIAVRERTAEEHGWKVGDTVAMEFPVGGVQRLPIKAIFKDNRLNDAYLLAMTDYTRHYADQLDSLAFVKAAEGVPAAAARAAVERAVRDFPVVQVKDQAQYKRDQARQIDQILALFYVLLALAVIIAFIGIVNTLALSVLERVRELGLLRAVGMTRAQLRAMVRWEAVIIAVFGGVLGLAVGVVFGWTLVRALRGQGITEFAVPVGTLLAFLAAAALAGVLAAVFPGRRAARIDILRAVTAE